MVDGVARKEESLFRRSCGVRVRVAAPRAAVWALLTDAEGFPRWNSTVTRIGGTIALGQKLAIQVPISERTFTPTVTRLDPGQQMTWSDGFWPMFRGVRTFELHEVEGGTDFAMEEVFTGLMLPMIARTLPDFGPPFEQYAKDLKRAAEEGA
ncbi:MAG: SRPBCC domain-containing protein [Alphaproteobacteria bacterium]|nr:SRPBCC domain-containing protein [Alphaproteobacteria bacterium]